MDMHSCLFSGEEEKPIWTFAKDRRAHSAILQGRPVIRKFSRSNASVNAPASSQVALDAYLLDLSGIGLRKSREGGGSFFGKTCG